MGGLEDVRIQSMTNTPTLETERTYRQVMALHEAGCEMVRLTARNIREAENIGVIRNMLERQGITIPLAADIHFNPRVAERAAAIVHKIRINPGNYLDQQYFLSKESKTKGRHADKALIREEIARLTKVCREHHTVIRVGVNHGSLSERVLMEYGNTAEGMIFSAMEFLGICHELDFHDLVVSMKSSHIKTMVKATLGIVEAMIRNDMDYPVHLGVTEAGAGEDGRIRSAAGIGPLLALGIGDTIRVSLTEDPVKEIPVAKKLVGIYRQERQRRSSMDQYLLSGQQKRVSKRLGVVGGHNPPAVVADSDVFEDPLRKADLIVSAGGKLIDREERKYYYRLLHAKDLTGTTGENLPEVNSDGQIFVYHSPEGESITAAIRNKLKVIPSGQPVIFRLSYNEPDQETFVLLASSEISSLLLSGLGDGFWLENGEEGGRIRHDLVFSILQATGVRITGTEYISCPGCGRTEFDLEKTLERVREQTRGLNNVKIAVMGCIVNGPGEMAGADYGYVGSGKAKVTLYRAGEVVKKNIPEEQAIEELLKLIGPQRSAYL